MTSIHAYYDGRSYVTQGAVVVKPNQKVIITLLDDFMPVRSKRSLLEIKSYMNGSSKSIPETRTFSSPSRLSSDILRIIEFYMFDLDN